MTATVLTGNPEDCYLCLTSTCDYIYDQGQGDATGEIPSGTYFEDLPPEWRCPRCGAGKKNFRRLRHPGGYKVAAALEIICDRSNC